MAQNHPLPDWAVVGAEVWLELGTYGRERRFRNAQVTRTTKASVFVKRVGADGNPNGTEYRFSRVEQYYRGYTPEERAKPTEYYMVEHGSRSALYSPANSLHAKDSTRVAEAVAQSARAEILLAAERATTEFTSYSPDTSKEDRARNAIAALTAYLADVEAHAK